RRRAPAALLRVEQGATRVDQARSDRPEREAEVDTRADRGRPDPVLQDQGARRRERVLPARSAEKARLGRETRGRGLARLAGGEQPADSGRVARGGGRAGAERVPRLGAVPE